MLTDLPDWLFGPDCPSAALLAKARAEHGDDFEFTLHPPRRLQRGVYESGLLSHDLEFANIKIENYPFTGYLHRIDDIDTRLKLLMSDQEHDMPRDYGVCDSYEQVLARWPQIDADERPLILCMRPVTCDDDAGWRWHKNGEYIGTQDPQYEHIGDEPVIEKVYMFSIIEILSVPDIIPASQASK